MKPDIHPEYVVTTGDLHLRQHLRDPQHRAERRRSTPTCARNCHPFYTGKQKILDTGGRVARFEPRYGKKARPASRPAGAKGRPVARRAGRRDRSVGAGAVARDRTGQDTDVRISTI